MALSPPDALHRLYRPLEMLAAPVPPSTVRGHPGLVDIWFLNYALDEIADVVRLWESWLPTEEQGRARRYQFAKHRRQYVAARALIRTALSRYAAPRPSEWRFEAGPFGKPVVSGPITNPPLHFNLSHTDGLIVCAISVAHAAVGIDAERSDRGATCVELMGSAYSADEICLLNRLPLDERQTECLVRWTLKESYAKAIGIGLSASFDRLSFRSDGLDIRLPFAPFGAERPASGWRFVVYELDQIARIALSVDTGGAPLVVRARRLGPSECVPS